MKNSRHSDTQTSKDVLNELHALVEQAERIMSDSSGEHSEDAMTTLRERFAAAKDRFAELYVGARKQVVAGAAYTDEAIRENPYQAVAVAAGIGLLFGMLVGRRSAQ